MERKERVLELLERGYEMEREFCAGFTEQERSQGGSWERWAVKDTIAHSAAWKAHLADGLAAVAEGRVAAPAGDYQHQNEVIFGEHFAKSWNEVESMAAKAHRSLVGQVSSLTPEELDSTAILPWQGERAMWRVALGTGFNHPLMHLSDHLKQGGQATRAADVVGELATSVAELDDSPDWQGVVQYNLACRHALLGEEQSAVDRLGNALDLSPRLLDYSRQDPDLETVRGDPACQALFARHDQPQSSHAG